MAYAMAKGRSPFIPWSEPGKWREANASLAKTLASHGHVLAGLTAAALRIKQGILNLEGLFSGICSQSCPVCDNNCCQRATIWYDFRDLLYLQLTDQKIPPTQTLTHDAPVCRYLAKAGCILARPVRPFICLWYVCADQKVLLDQMSPGQSQNLQHRLALLKQARKQIEASFFALLR